MRLSTLCAATALAIGSVGFAYAAPTSTNLVSNGDFAACSTANAANGCAAAIGDVGLKSGTPAPSTSSAVEFGTGKLNGFSAAQFIQNWSGNNGYEIWYPNATTAVNTQAYSEWGTGGANTGKEMLYGAIPALPDGITTFVGMDGDACGSGSFTGVQNCNAPPAGTNGIQGSISQSVTLTKGKTYKLSFWWGAGQLQSRTGNTLSSFGVTVGAQALNSIQDVSLTGDGGNDGSWPVYDNYLSNPSESFTGWKQQSYTFTADAGGSQLLTFLSMGAPGGLPPFAVLTGVSLTAVPEPADLGMMGLGLLVIGGVVIFERRRRTGRQLDNRDAA